MAGLPAVTRESDVGRFAEPLAHRVAWASIRAACRLIVRRIELRVEGLEHFPSTGPVIVAARHFHHLYDGSALIAIVPRPLHLLVALDWLEQPIGRRLMTQACDIAGWPVVSRLDRPERPGGPSEKARLAANLSRLRGAARKCVGLLRAGQPLLVFPEGYPNIDPHYTPKTDEDAFLPFQPGFLRFVAMAQRDGRTSVPIIPVGLEYSRGDRWSLIVRFGLPVAFTPDISDAEQVFAIEEQVRRLSGDRDALHDEASRMQFGPAENGLDRR